MSFNRPNIYIAAPLFTPQEQLWNRTLRDSLAGLGDVYLPQEDGALLVHLIADGMRVQDAKFAVFNRDIEAIDRCSILLLVMDGRVIDEGACFELGYAHSRGKICVGLKTDVRSLLTVGDNPMIECALRAIFKSPQDMIAWIGSGKWLPN